MCILKGIVFVPVFLVCFVIVWAVSQYVLELIGVPRPVSTWIGLVATVLFTATGAGTTAAGRAGR